jgi:hypothetical protein
MAVQKRRGPKKLTAFSELGRVTRSVSGEGAA